ncbi:MAG: multidrug effflux MFS transporter [Beijerinckiaceae bacterium]
MQDHPQPGTIRPGHFLPGSWPFIITLAMLMALLPLSTDMYLPSLPSILLGLQATPVRVQWTLSALMIGMAAGQVISGPLSDVYGRKPVLMAGLGLFLLAAIMCATAPTIEVLIMGRALAGFAMAGPAVLVRAMVRDLYHGAAAGRELSRMGAVMGLVPGILPVLGGVIEQHWGWRGNFVFAAVWTILFGLIAWRALPETLERRSERWPGILGILKGYPAVMGVGRWWAYALTLMFSHAGLFCFISGSAFVLQKSRGLSPLEFGIAFGITGLAYAAGAFLAQKVVRIQGLDRTIFAGTLALAGAGMAAALLALNGIVHVAALVVPMCIYNIGHGLVQPQCQAGALTPFPHNAGAASSLLGIVQMIFSAGSGIYYASWLAITPDALPVGLALSGLCAFFIFLLMRVLRQRRPDAA